MNDDLKNKPRILVVGPSWVGDMVMAQSLFKILKARKDTPTVDVVAPAWSTPILERMPEVDHFITLNVGHGELGLKKRFNLGRALNQQYSQAIIVPRSLKAALTPFFASIPIRTGFLGEMRYGLLNDIRLFDKKKLDQTVKRFAALGLPANAPIDSLPQPKLTVDNNNQQALCQTLKLDLSRPAVALLPGAEYGPAKQWPIEHFHNLARRLIERGKQVWVIGSQKEFDAGEHIITGLGEHAKNLSGKTQLADAIDLLGLASHCVTNDSGLMHIAAAVDTPVIAIYGSSSPGFTPPLTDRATIHYKNLSCSPCFKRECPLVHLDCLTTISVDEVAQSIENIESSS